MLEIGQNGKNGPGSDLGDQLGAALELETWTGD